MGWGRRRNQNVRDYSKAEVSARVARKMTIRHQMLAPCPVKPTEIYRHLWTKDERAALRLLRERMPTALRYDSDMTLDWNVRPFIVETAITDPRVPSALFFRFSKTLPAPCTDAWNSSRDTLGVSRLPEPMLDTLEEWAKRWVKLDTERMYVCEQVDRIFDACNTMGQLHRLWPNLCSFLPERGQAVVRNIKVRSRLPEAVLHYDEDKDPENEHPLLEDEWKPEALAPYDALITEALLLPDDIELPPWEVTVSHGVQVAC